MSEAMIVSRPEILGGKPCVRDTRLSVEFILELAASGATQEQILSRYPHLTPEGLAAMQARGFSVFEVDRMSKQNPATLLGLR